MQDRKFYFISLLINNSATVGAVQYGDKLETVVVSEAMKTSATLQKMATELGVSVVILQDVWNAIGSDIRSELTCRHMVNLVIEGREYALMEILDYSRWDPEYISEGSQRIRHALDRSVSEQFRSRRFEQFSKTCDGLLDEIRSSFERQEHHPRPHELLVQFYKKTSDMYREMDLPEKWHGEISVDTNGTLLLPIKPNTIPRRFSSGQHATRLPTVLTSIDDIDARRSSPSLLKKQAPTNDADEDEDDDEEMNQTSEDKRSDSIANLVTDDHTGDNDKQHNQWTSQVNEIRELQNLLSLKDKRIESLLDKIQSMQAENDEIRRQLMLAYRKDRTRGSNRQSSFSSGTSGGPFSCFPCLTSPKKIHPM
jgi:hypothetical protein